MQIEYPLLKKSLESLENLNKNSKITINELEVSKDFAHLYYYAYFFFLRKNKLGLEKLKEFYPDFDIFFVKEALAKGTKILIYHFPSLYNDLAYLFEDADKYFKENW